MKKLLFVYNSHAGKASIKSKLADMIDLMIKSGYQVSVHPVSRLRRCIQSGHTLRFRVRLCPLHPLETV